MALIFRLVSGISPLARTNATIPLKKSYQGNQCEQISRGIKRFVTPVRIIMKRRKDNMDSQPPNHRNTYLEWNYNAELFAFGKRLGEDFDKDLLQQAFIERSYIIMEEEKQKKVDIEEPNILLKDNTEFAKRGESMVSDYTKRYLRTVYPRFPEEGICSVSDYLLTDDVLADISKNIGTSDIILASEQSPSSKTLANVLKAIIHALKESSGEDRANMFIRDFIITYLSGKDINELWTIKNPKSVLNSILHKEGRKEIEARLIGEAGKNTILSAFQIGLYCDKELIGMGYGETITIAKETAILDALKRLFHTTECAKPIPFDLVLSLNKKGPFANISIQDWCEENIKTMVTKM